MSRLDSRTLPVDRTIEPDRSRSRVPETDRKGLYVCDGKCEWLWMLRFVADSMPWSQVIARVPLRPGCGLVPAASSC